MTSRSPECRKRVSIVASHRRYVCIPRARTPEHHALYYVYDVYVISGCTETEDVCFEGVHEFTARDIPIQGADD